MGNIAGKVAIITGAGRGIGRAIALAYGREGAKVVVASRTSSTVDSVVAQIERNGGMAVGIPCDVGQRDQVFGLVARAAKVFGTVDILVNNAQSFGSARKPAGSLYLQPLETLDEEEWDNIYRTGLMSTLWGMKAAFPYLKTKGGKIINFGSATGQIGLGGAAAYNATKEGIRALTRTAAREWGKYRITANVINPALKTDSWDEFARENPERVASVLKDIPVGRLGDPETDVGPLAVFLGSSDSDYITGMTFMLNGGRFIFP
jgi:NAD(P)-dependent dehydrogenase (short-subunit alcohol dehydrogenase family)